MNVNYTAKFSTKTLYRDYKHNNDLEQDVAFASGEAGGAEVQVWALITGNPPNVPIGTKAAFPYDVEPHHAVVKKYIGKGQWAHVAFLPSHHNRID